VGLDAESGQLVKTRPSLERHTPTRAFASAKAWNTWLVANHAKSKGLWLKLAKKASGIASVTYPEAVEVALIWGWIDGQKNKLDDTWWLQRFVPRLPKSSWSQINRTKALALIAAGKMKPPGLAEVERAKADGRWQSAYAPASRMQVPPDFVAALAKNARARKAFENIDSRNRYTMLHRIVRAKKSETRTRLVEKFVGMLEKGEKLYP
jgi:uncharacterized protein YdeI (YjbR/CyaY-like superfamily)